MKLGLVELLHTRLDLCEVDGVTCRTDAGDVAPKIPLKTDFLVIKVRVRKNDDLGFRIADVFS